MRRSGHVVERIPHIDGHALKLCGGRSGDVLELIGEVLDAAVSKFVGDFTECPFAILQKLLCALNTLADDVLFDGDILHGGKQRAEVVVLQAKFLAQICGVFEFPVSRFADESDNRELQLFDGAGLPILNELKSILFQCFLDLIHREVAGTSRESDLSQCHVADIKTDFFQLLRHDADTPVTNHVLDIERHR